MIRPLRGRFGIASVPSMSSPKMRISFCAYTVKSIPSFILTQVPCISSLPPMLRAEYRSEEHTSELQSLMRISYAVFCLKKKNSVIYTMNNNDTQSHQLHYTQT